MLDLPFAAQERDIITMATVGRTENTAATDIRATYSGLSIGYLAIIDCLQRSASPNVENGKMHRVKGPISEMGLRRHLQGAQARSDVYGLV